MSAAAAVLEALAERIEPRPHIPLSQWLSENLVLVDGPLAGRLWSAKGAPYLAEIADCLGDDHPATLVTVRKSQQTGASILALGWTLYIAEQEPANTLYAVPGIDALRDLNSGKLQPLIDAWQRRTGKAIIDPQTSRSGSGSTTYEKVFPGGRLWLANANTVMDLSSKTAKKGVKDELSKWQEIPGFGDPEILFEGRFTAFRRRRTHKILEISTPEVDSGDETGDGEGHCRIDRSFRKSDQRFWHCQCPACGDFFVHDDRHFHADEAHPHKSFYACQTCGGVIDDIARMPMILGGRWRPTALEGARHPGFHIDAFISTMMSYEAIAEDRIKSSRRGETGRKDYSNVVLGLPYLFKGDAPDHVRLMERREDYRRGHVPPRGLILVAAADVQARGIWLEVTAFAPNRESWTVEVDYLSGSTEAPDGEAFQKLRAKTLDHEFPDAFGGKRKIDALGVDSGFRSHIVYAFVRANQRVHPDSGQDMVLALDGRDGWSRPAIGTPTLVDINLAGGKVRKGCKLWPVGTWPLKGAFYADLGKTGIRSGGKEDPGGMCHFGDWLDENYFKQITAEFLAEETLRGKIRKVWKIAGGGRDNHLLDCRVYNLSLAEYLGLSAITPDEWAALAKARGMPADDVPGLFKPRAPLGAPESETAASASPGAASPPPRPETQAERFKRLAKANAERFR